MYLYDEIDQRIVDERVAQFRVWSRNCATRSSTIFWSMSS